jgi:hypothetical protein
MLFLMLLRHSLGLMAAKRVLYCWAIICCWSGSAFRVPFAKNYRLNRHASSSNVDVKSLYEGDVIVISHNKVVSLAAVTSSKTLQPLALRQTSRMDELDEGGTEITLYEDEEQEPFALTGAILGEVVDDVVFTQRCVEDRISNPHGEHAEDVWLVSNQNIIKSISAATIFLPLRSGH